MAAMRRDAAAEDYGTTNLTLDRVDVQVLYDHSGHVCQRLKGGVIATIERWIEQRGGRPYRYSCSA